MMFVPIEPINVHAKFECRSFTRYWDKNSQFTYSTVQKVW